MKFDHEALHDAAMSVWQTVAEPRASAVRAVLAAVAAVLLAACCSPTVAELAADPTWEEANCSGVIAIDSEIPSSF